jgi:hypothetical protein
MSTKLNSRQSLRWVSDKMEDESKAALGTYNQVANPRKNTWPEALEEMIQSKLYDPIIKNVYKLEHKAVEYGSLPGYVAITLLFADPERFAKDVDSQPRAVMSIILARFGNTTIEGTNPFVAMQEMAEEDQGNPLDSPWTDDNRPSEQEVTDFLEAIDRPDSSERLYAWQTLNPETVTWDLIGMAGGGMHMPLVTTKAATAEALEAVARRHLAETGQAVRLIAYVPGAILNVIEPDDLDDLDEPDDDERIESIDHDV